MVGAKGLNGKSWPDLDMLPLGWLSRAATNEGPHRKCSLTLNEQSTQVTLWSIAKYPLMFGGDMRQLDDSTFHLISNPTLLEMNSFSSNNMEFQHISSTKIGQVRYLKENIIPKVPILSLTSCEDVKARGWNTMSVEGDLEHVCWNGSSSVFSEEPFCLYKRSPRLFLDENVANKQLYDGKVHLLKTRKAAVCFGASPNQRLTSNELKRGSFSTCTWSTNQMWELSNNGTLRNSYSGLCASMRTVRAKSGPNGSLAWIATGRKGKVYVAFFNLDLEKVLVSMKIA